MISQKVLNQKSIKVLKSRHNKLNVFLLFFSCFLACISLLACISIVSENTNHAYADTNEDLCCSYKQTSVNTATIQVTGVSSYTATSLDTSIATVTQSGEMVTVTGADSAVGIARINIAYSGNTYTVEVPIGYTVFSFDEDSLTVMPGSSTNFQIDAIDYTQEDEIENISPTITEPYNVYTNSDTQKILVSLKKKGGTYVFTGHGDNMSINVKKEASATSTILMADCHLTSGVTSPLTIKKDGTVQTIVTALAGHSNSLTDNEFNNADIYGPTEEGGSGENQYWAESAVIKAKTSANLLLNGNGNLLLTCKTKNGIKVGESGNLTIENINLDVESVDHGISSDNATTINSGSLVINSVGDALRSDPDSIVAGTTAGTITINGGTFDITTNSDGDAIQAASDLNITDGNFNITTGGGHSQSIGDDESAKGIKSGITLEISGGEYVLDCADDAVHANSDASVSGGHFKIETADDAMHAGDSEAYLNAKLTLGTTGGSEPYVNITTCYEGLEGAQVIINSGTYNIVGTDDGINSANGTDPQPGTSSNCNIIVNGGNIYVNVDGDGFDANGDITINAGTCIVFGMKAQGENAPYDCDGTFYINGGTVFGAGSSSMPVTPSSASQTYVTYGGGQPGPGPGPGPQPPNDDSQIIKKIQLEDYSEINPGPGGESITSGQTVDVKNASSTTAFSVKTPKDVNYVIYSSSDTTSSWSITGDSTTPTWSKFDMPTCLTSGHNFTSTYVVEPNCLGIGTIKKTCSVCGATSYVTVDALGHDMVDNTCTRCGYGEGTKTDITSASVSAVEDQTFTGSVIMPTPIVELGGYTLVKDVDYTLSYANNINAGTATIYIIGRGNYKGTITKSFAIKKATIDVPVAEDDITYDGTEHIGVPFGEGYSIVDNKRTNAGSYTAVATLDSNHIWSDSTTEVKNIPWTIKQATGSITFSSNPVEVVWTYSETVTPTIVSDGTVAVSSSAENVATVTYENEALTITGLSVGQTIITVATTGGTNYSDATATLTVNVVAAGTAQIPTAKTGLVYNAAEQTGVDVGSGFTITGNTATNAGNYTATAKLKDGYTWSDSTTSDKTINWSIAKAAGSITISSPSTSVAISKSTALSANIIGDGYVSATTSDAAIATASINGGTLTINGIGVGEATITVSVDEGTNYTSATDTTEVTVSYIGQIAAPNAVAGLVYNGEVKVGVQSGEGYTLSNNTATNAGTYTATATLVNGYIWKDGTLEPKTIDWSIAKADGQISFEQSSVTVEKGSISNVTFNRAGDGVVTAESSEESVATVTLTSSALSITGTEKGSCSITVNVAEGTNHKATSAQLPVTVTYTPTISKNGVTLSGDALESALLEGETLNLDVTKQTESDTGYKKAYNEFMTNGDYKKMFVYDIKLSAVNSTTGASRSILELDDKVSMTIDLGTSEFNGKETDVQEYHTTEASKEVTIPYKGLKAEDTSVKLNVEKFSQFNVLIVKDSVTPGSDSSDSTINSVTSSTGDVSLDVIVFVIFGIVAIGFCTYKIRRNKLKSNN